MMLKIFFGNQMEKDQLAMHLQKMSEYHNHLLKKYEKEVEPVIQRYASTTGAFNDARYWAFTLEFGEMHAKMVTEWSEKLLKALNMEKASSKPTPEEKTWKYKKRRTRV